MPDDLDLCGQMLSGRFEVLARIGSGGMGTVYRAHDRELDESVALKVIRHELANEPDVVERVPTRGQARAARDSP